MPLDPELVAETQAWLGRALDDLRAAEALAVTSPPLLGEAAFHCQQAAEKTLKGLLTWRGRTFRKTHNLEEVGELALVDDPVLRNAVDKAVPLTEYAWKFRYPGTPCQPGAEEVDEALAIAQELLESVFKLLPPEVRP